MRRRDVVAASVPACIVMSVLGPLLTGVFWWVEGALTGGSTTLEEVALIGAYGYLPGMMATALLGPIPVALAVWLWKDAQEDLGTARAINAVSLVVAVTAMAELFLPVCIFTRPVGAALALLAAYGLLAGLVTKIALGLTWRAVSPWDAHSRAGRTR